MSMYYRFSSVAGRLVRASPHAYYPQGFAPLASQATQTKLLYEYESTAPLKVASHLSVASGSLPISQAAAFSTEPSSDAAAKQAYEEYLAERAKEYQFTEKVTRCIIYMLLPCFIGTWGFILLLRKFYGKGVDRWRLRDLFDKDKPFDYIWGEKPGKI